VTPKHQKNTTMKKQFLTLDGDDAEVFLGLPRNFNAGFRVSF
jgi:hypothetical protein